MTTIAYIRWSTLEQGNADRSSEERQLANTIAYSKRANLVIDEVLTDKGRSAFNGQNLTKGELGKLASRIESGEVRHLIVEELDRLSRRPPGDMMTWIIPLLRAGLALHIANTGQVITEDTVNRDFGGFVTMMSSAFVAYEFSRKQQDRGNAAWEKRRSAAKEGQATSRHRARKWLKWNPVTKVYEPLPERVALIKEMFALRIDGMGKSAIARLFNTRALTDPRYRVWPSTAREPNAWTPSAIARIVQDTAVLGFVQYSRFPRGADKRVPIGDPVQVYPAIIDEVTFARANSKRVENQLAHQGRGRALSNLLGQVSVCGECGGRVTAMGSSRWRTNKAGERHQHYYLYCTAAKNDKTCTNQQGWRYHPIEQTILSTLLTLSIDTNDDNLVIEAEGQVEIAEQTLSKLKTQADRILHLVMDGDEAANRLYAAKKQEIEDASQRLSEARRALLDARGSLTSDEQLERVAALRTAMESDDEMERYQARSVVKAALRDLVERVTFNSKGFVGVQLVDRLRMFSMNKDGEIISDLELHKLFPDLPGSKVTVREGGRTWVEGPTVEQEQVSRDYRRRVSQTPA